MTPGRWPPFAPLNVEKNPPFYGENATFLVFSTLQRGEGGEDEKISQDYWPRLLLWAV